MTMMKLLMMMVVMMMMMMMMMIYIIKNLLHFIQTFNWIAMVTGETGHLRLYSYFKELLFI